MECEICGRETDKTKTIELEGADYIVCLGCSHLGRDLAERKPVPERTFKPAERKPVQLSRPREPSFEEETELVEGYGTVIRKEREKKGLTVKELAMKLFEKESVMHRIESGRFEPSAGLVKKIEGLFGISLRKKTEEGKEFKPTQSFKKRTLADLLAEKKEE